MYLVYETEKENSASGNYGIAVIYVPQEGKAKLSGVKKLDLAELPVLEDGTEETLPGGWQAVSKVKAGALTEEAESAFEEAAADDQDVSLIPVVLLGSQAVSGANYTMLCYGMDGEKGNVYAVTVWKNAEGKSSVNEIHILDLAALAALEEE